MKSVKKSSLTKFIIPNGLQVIVQPLTSIHSVTLYLAVRAGPRFETTEMSGMAHFLEHMLFEGTTNFLSSKEVAKYIENVGGRSGAFTEKEFVIFHVKIPKEHVEIGVRYLSEILFKSTLKEEAIEKEKKIVLEELKRKIDNPEVEIWDLWSEWTWGKNQSLGRSTLGDKDSIESFTRNKLKEYLDKYYIPSNMVLTVVGNVTVKAVQKSLGKYFTNIKSKRVFKPDRLNFLYKSPPLKIIQRKSEQNQIIVGFYTGVSLLDKDRIPLQILVDVLCGRTSSRLFHKLVYDLGLAYFVNAGNWFFSDTGLFYIFGGLSTENIEKALTITVNELNNLKMKIISKEELKEVKIKTKSELIFSTETSDNLAYLYASQQLLENRLTTIDHLLQKIDSITPVDIQRVARKYLRSKNLSVTIQGPLNKSYEIKITNLLANLKY